MLVIFINRAENIMLTKVLTTPPFFNKREGVRFTIKL